MAGFKKRSRDDADEQVPKRKTFDKKQKNAATAAAVAQDDTPTWEIGNKRRLTISKFNNRVLVNIREYYEKDGDFLPGKKGISLTTEQWESITSVVDAVNGALRAQGVVLKGDDAIPDADSDEAMETDSDPKPAKKSKGKAAEKAASKSSKHKSNIEATSDEDDGPESDEPDDES